jgi:predicted dehydrogenase
MTKLKSVVIGCGAIAREHLAALRQMENVDVAAVCDLSPARAEAAAERFNVGNWFSSLDALLSHTIPNLVHIATPPNTHFSITKTCLEAGLNVLCEKPITVNYAEFKILKELALQKNCMLMEDQNLRFHSSIRRIKKLMTSGEMGDLVDVQVFLCLNITAPDSPFVDQNVPHPSWALPGGPIGDFLPHIAYLAHMFSGPITDIRTIWKQRTVNSPIPGDEFRGFLKGERATAHVAFSSNARPNGFWVRVTGTQMYAEANLFEPPRLILRKLRAGEPSLASLVDGMAEARQVLSGSVAGFWRKLGGVSSYDGLPELVRCTYQALEMQKPQPIPLEEIDATSLLVDRLTDAEFKL